MALTDIGNCRHYWEFNSSNFSGGEFQDQVGSANASLNTGSPSYVSTNSVEGLDLSGGTQYLSFDDTECMGEVSFIQVIGYRGGGQAYGLCTLSSTTGYNFWHGASANNSQFFRSATALTNDAPLDQSYVNVTTSGVRLASGIIFMKVDADSEFTNNAQPAANDAMMIKHDGWQFGRRYTTLDPMQQVYEMAAYIGDVTQDPDYFVELKALTTKYGIPVTALTMTNPIPSSTDTVGTNSFSDSNDLDSHRADTRSPSITPTVDMSLTSITIPAGTFSGGPSGSISLVIKDGNLDSDATLATSSAESFSGFTGTNAINENYETFTFSPAVDLTAGNTYKIQYSSSVTAFSFVFDTAPDSPNSEMGVLSNTGTDPYSGTAEPLMQFTGNFEGWSLSTGDVISVTNGVASGGFGDYTYTVNSGSLPNGMSLNSSTGEISGTAGAAGSGSFVIRVTDQANQTVDSDSLDWTIT